MKHEPPMIPRNKKQRSTWLSHIIYLAGTKVIGKLCSILLDPDKQKVAQLFRDICSYRDIPFGKNVILTFHVLHDRMIRHKHSVVHRKGLEVEKQKFGITMLFRFFLRHIFWFHVALMVGRNNRKFAVTAE